jgi:(2Fe-2S) ferredoxin
MNDLPNRKRRAVLICQYRSCSRNGAAEVLQAFQTAAPVGVAVSGCGCQGQCASGVTVRVIPDGSWYCQIRPGHVSQIVDQHLCHDQPVVALLHPRFHPQAAEQLEE